MTTIKDTLPDDTAIKDVCISRGAASAVLMTYGATLREFHFEDVPYSLTLGSHDRRSYAKEMLYFGAIVGPIANRITDGKVPLEGAPLQLDVNENGNALHGGKNGLSQQIWTIKAQDAHSVTFGHVVADGFGGLPGPIDIGVTYTIEEDGALTLDIIAETERTTFFNPAFHGFWSLTGEGLAEHRLKIDADHYLPVDAALLPTGEIAPVQGTPYDFRKSVPLPANVELDTNFCLNGMGMRPVAWLETAELALVIETNAPGLQVYDAARMDTSPVTGLQEQVYGAYAGIAIEPQFWPDAPNNADFPPITLRAGEVFRQSSRFCFSRKGTPAAHS